MKSKLLLFLLGLGLQTFSLAQNCINQARYQEYVAKGQKLVAQGDYIQAIEYYNSAKDFCQEKSKEIDGLVEEMVKKIDNERLE